MGESDCQALQYKPVRNGKQRKKFELYLIFFLRTAFLKIPLLSSDQNEEFF